MLRECTCAQDIFNCRPRPCAVVRCARECGCAPADLGACARFLNRLQRHVVGNAFKKPYLHTACRSIAVCANASCCSTMQRATCCVNGIFRCCNSHALRHSAGCPHAVCCKHTVHRGSVLLGCWRVPRIGHLRGGRAAGTGAIVASVARRRDGGVRRNHAYPGSIAAIWSCSAASLGNSGASTGACSRGSGSLQGGATRARRQ
jgi:hypothetical protein